MIKYQAANRNKPLTIQDMEVLLMKSAVLVDMHGEMAVPFLEWAEARYRALMKGKNAQERVLRLLKEGDESIGPSRRYADGLLRLDGELVT